MNTIKNAGWNKSTAILLATLTFGSLNATSQEAMQNEDGSQTSFRKSYDRGKALLTQGLADSAVASLEYAQILVPDHDGAKIHLTRAYLATGDLKSAESVIENVVNNDSSNASAFFVYGRVRHNLGQKIQATWAYKRSIQLREYNPFAYNNLGLIHLTDGDYEEALSLFQKAIEQKSDIDYFHNNLGMAYEGTRRLEDARSSFQNALELNPDNAKAFTNLGRIEGLLGISNDSVTDVEQPVQVESLEEETPAQLDESSYPVTPEKEIQDIDGWQAPEGDIQPLKRTSSEEKVILHAGSPEQSKRGGIIVKLLGISCLVMVLAVAFFVRHNRRNHYVP